MLTSWGEKLISIVISHGNYGGAYILPELTSFGDGNKLGVIEAKDTSGQIIYLKARANAISKSLNVNSSSYGNSAGVFIGSDDTTATKNNYDLGNRIINFASSSQISPSISDFYNENDDNFVLCLDYPISNNTNNSLIIREVGYMIRCSGSTTKGEQASLTKQILIDRTVLDAPLEIPAGEARTLRYEFIYG